MSFVLNGAPVSVGDHPHLLAALREELDVTSPKDGCSPTGQCGCCTVLVDGKPTVSCSLTLDRVAGKAVTTLEGLDADERARYAGAFAATGALQCGFCTPGIVMRTKYLVDKDGPALTREKAARHLGGHLCRCTGYHPILDAVDLLAAGKEVDPRPGRGRRRPPPLRHRRPHHQVPGPRPGAGRQALRRRPAGPRDAARRPGAGRPRPGRRPRHRHRRRRRGPRGRAGADRSRRARRAAHRAHPPGLAGVHPGRRADVLHRRPAGARGGAGPGHGPPRRRAGRGRLPAAPAVRRRPGGARIGRAGRVGGRRPGRAQRAVPLGLRPRRRRGRRPGRQRPHRARGVPDPAHRARLPGARVHPGGAPRRRHPRGVLRRPGRVGRPPPDRGRARHRRGPRARPPRRQRRRLRRQGGLRQPDPDRPGRLAARPPREVHVQPGGVAARPPQAPPGAGRVLGRVRRRRPGHGAEGPHRGRLRPLRVRGHEGAGTGRRPRQRPLLVARRGRRGRGRAHQQPGVRGVPGLRRQPGPVRHRGRPRPPGGQGGHRPPGRSGRATW